MQLPKGSLDILRQLTAEEKATLKLILGSLQHCKKHSEYRLKDANHSSGVPHISGYVVHIFYEGKVEALDFLVRDLFNMWLKTKK